MLEGKKYIRLLISTCLYGLSNSSEAQYDWKKNIYPFVEAQRKTNFYLPRFLVNFETIIKHSKNISITLSNDTLTVEANRLSQGISENAGVWFYNKSDSLKCIDSLKFTVVNRPRDWRVFIRETGQQKMGDTGYFNTLHLDCEYINNPMANAKANPKIRDFTITILSANIGLKKFQITGDSFNLSKLIKNKNAEEMYVVFHDVRLDLDFPRFTSNSFGFPLFTENLKPEDYNYYICKGAIRIDNRIESFIIRSKDTQSISSTLQNITPIGRWKFFEVNKVDVGEQRDRDHPNIKNGYSETELYFDSFGNKLGSGQRIGSYWIEKWRINDTLFHYVQTNLIRTDTVFKGMGVSHIDPCVEHFSFLGLYISEDTTVSKKIMEIDDKLLLNSPIGKLEYFENNKLIFDCHLEVVTKMNHSNRNGYPWCNTWYHYVSFCKPDYKFYKYDNNKKRKMRKNLRQP